MPKEMTPLLTTTEALHTQQHICRGIILLKEQSILAAHMHASSGRLRALTHTEPTATQRFSASVSG